VTLEELFAAYFECRKNKRKTKNAQKFEMNYEERLIKLRDEINNGTYKIGRSIAFVVEKPVKREIFAADFRDRVVHHLVIQKLNALFEKEFIYDSYSCRVGKGTLFGVKRLSRFIRACSENFTKETYVLKLDIKGFFMHINREILFRKLQKFIESKYVVADQGLLIEIVEQIVQNDCTERCFVKSPRWKWDDLPPDKSLFNNDGSGIPIGNLTSQVFANFYLSTFDHFMKSTLKLRYYGRYVDDFFVVHNDKDYLKNLIPVIEKFLKDELHLTLHPKKRILQNAKHGVKFTGAFIKQHLIYIDKRAKGNLYQVIDKWNKDIESESKKNVLNSERFTPEEFKHFQASVNSYLGFMVHYRTYNLRKKMCQKISPRFHIRFKPKKSYTKIG
jgi:hypothetical protein